MQGEGAELVTPAQGAGHMAAEFLLLLPRLFLQRLRISQAGAEATEPASWHIHQPLHGEGPVLRGGGRGLSFWELGTESFQEKRVT